MPDSTGQAHGCPTAHWSIPVEVAKPGYQARHGHAARLAAGELTRSSWNTSLVSMKNVTVLLDEEVALWARIWAARHNTSVSRLLGELLAERMREETGYEAAMRRFLSRRPKQLKNKGESYPDRDELHERDLLR